MKFKAMIYLPAVLIAACSGGKTENNSSLADKKPGKLQQFVVAENNLTPTVDIKNFTLICDDSAAYITDAKEIMKVKRNWPLAMQRKDSALFDEILADDFSFRASYEFYPDKKSYISNRVSGTWTIDTVYYENLALQFFNDMAILTYHNKLIGTDSIGKPDIEHYAWADFYVKENNKWKIKGSHEIDARIEYPAKK